MYRILLILLFFIFTNEQFAQVCELQSGGSVTVEFANFSVNNITDNGANCTLEYSVDYKVNNPDGCGVSLQSVVLSETGSQTNFNISTGGTWHTTTGTVYNTSCSGTLELRVSGNWGYPCTQTQVNYPGVTCSIISYGLLPVELTSFFFLEKNKQLFLEWETASEIDNDYFEIEHSSDGENFNSIGKVQGVGNSTMHQRYSFLSENPFGGMNYYRLKQVDFDGNFEYTKVISQIFYPLKNEWSIYPNPISDFIFLKSKTANNDDTNTFTIFNNLGNLILEGDFQDEKQINLSGFPKGIYFIFIKNKTGIFSEKIIKG